MGWDISTKDYVTFPSLKSRRGSGYFSNNFVMSFDVLLYGDPIYYLVTVRAYIKVRELSQSQREFQIQSGADLIGPRCCNHVLFEQLLIAQ